VDDHRSLHTSREVAADDHVVTGATSSLGAASDLSGVAGATRAGVNAWSAG
jgi:hypothetical protein